MCKEKKLWSAYAIRIHAADADWDTIWDKYIYVRAAHIVHWDPLVNSSCVSSDLSLVDDHMKEKPET